MILSLYYLPLHVNSAISSVLALFIPWHIFYRESAWKGSMSKKNMYFGEMLQAFIALIAIMSKNTVISSTSKRYHRTDSTNNIAKVKRSQNWRETFSIASWKIRWDESGEEKGTTRFPSYYSSAINWNILTLVWLTHEYEKCATFPFSLLDFCIRF